MAEQRIIIHRFFSVPAMAEEDLDEALDEFIGNVVQGVYQETEGRATIEDIDVRPFTFSNQIVCIVKCVFLEHIDPLSVDFDALERFEPNDLNLALGNEEISDYEMSWSDGRMWADVLMPNGQEIQLISDKEGRWYIFPEEAIQDG